MQCCAPCLDAAGGISGSVAGIFDDEVQPVLACAVQPFPNRGTSHVQHGVSSSTEWFISPCRGHTDQVAALCCDAGRSLQVSIPLQVTLTACSRLKLQGQAALALLSLAKEL